MTPDLPGVQLSLEGAIGRLDLARPDKLNPLSTATLTALRDAARWFDDQPECKVVIVGGQGRVFSAGADLSSFTGGAPAPDQPLGRDAADRGRIMADAIEAMRAVTVARLHGWCVGGGVVLAAACDLRVATDDTRFSIPEVDLGIPLAWGGIPRLVREIGPARTKELVMTCRPFDAAEALAMGFVNRVVPVDELDGAVAELAEQLAAKAGQALRATKAHTNAVTAAMVGLSRSWADADGLETGLHDPEGRAAAQRYLDELTARRSEA
ncbi:MAG: enoyl-CoA hydratase/isomerase family protein [Acidimicrobiia bacterium]|nr:enoyl-CoA hydratase/isomerase family protein [Acidimicrobiia bacterium]